MKDRLTGGNAGATVYQKQNHIAMEANYMANSDKTARTQSKIHETCAKTSLRDISVAFVTFNKDTCTPF